MSPPAPRRTLPQGGAATGGRSRTERTRGQGASGEAATDAVLSFAAMARPLRIDDLTHLPVVSDPVLARDGASFACTVRTWNLAEDGYRTCIWAGPVSGAEPPRPLTDERRGGFDPSFSPDGRFLAFLSDRKDGTSEAHKGPRTVDIWALDLRGGDAIRLTRLPGRCSRLAWSPDSHRLLFLFQPNDPESPIRSQRIAEVLRQAGETIEGVQGRSVASVPSTSSPGPSPQEKDEGRKPIAHRVTRLHWREDGRGILPQHRSQLWTLDVSALEGTPLWQWAEIVPGDARLSRLTAGAFDVQDPAFAPDGARIAFIANRSADPDRLSGLYDIWVVSSRSGASGAAAGNWDGKLAGIQEPLRLQAPPGPKFAPVWSPDGRHVAYLAHDEPLDLWGSRNFHVWSVAADGKEAARDLMPEFDRSASTLVLSDTAEMHPYTPPVWCDGGRTVAFLATDGPRVGLYEVPAQGGEPDPIHEIAASLMSLAATPDGRRFVFLATTSARPPDVWTVGPGETPRRLTRFGADWAGALLLSEPQLVPVACPEGHTIEAWLLRPPAFDATAKHPLVLQIHGGPYAAYGDAFVFEFQWLAAQGYCVLFANPRGSQGYGHEFAAAIRKNLAAPAHADLMAAVDLVADRSYVDTNRLGVTGGSWGGYMTNWIVTQTERFRAALAQRSICDFEVDFGTSDFGYEVEWMFGGPPWTHREVYERCSPLTYVEHVRTPLLLLHSEEDWRCPPTHAEIFYGALKMLGREAEMVRFPKESHGLSRGGTPSRRLERLRVLGEWFARHLTPERPDLDVVLQASGEPPRRAPEGPPAH